MFYNALLKVPFLSHHRDSYTLNYSIHHHESIENLTAFLEVSEK